MSQKKIYDAIIVGSGAAGGIAAQVLVDKGLNVLLLEIGPKWDRHAIFHTEHSWPYEMPFRGLGKPGQYDGLWKISAYTEHLYVHPYKDRYALAPGTDFHWTRIHAVGGRTNIWARVSLRFSEFDFKPGDATHEVGTARMGDDPKTSVLNKWNQAHEVKNLLVVDGAAFTSLAEKNCTLTIAVLAWRACDHLAEEMRTGAFG